MIKILNDIRKAYNADALRSAFALALTLPDICGQIEYPDKDCGERYALWIDNFLEDTHKCTIFDVVISDNNEIESKIAIDGRTYYRLRCTYLHSGSTTLTKDGSDYPEFQFVTFSTEDTNIYGNVLVDINGKKMLNIDIRNEINKLLHAAINYYKTHSSNSEFERHKIEILDLERHVESIRKDSPKTYKQMHETSKGLAKNLMRKMKESRD